MFRTILAVTTALAVIVAASTATANSAPEDCWNSSWHRCDPCHADGYTGVCVEMEDCASADDDDSAGDCPMTCATNADSELIAEQCPDADELPACECSASGAMGAATIPGFALLLGLATVQMRRRGRERDA